jgi:ABC-type transport system substrate-binding protein
MRKFFIKLYKFLTSLNKLEILLITLGFIISTFLLSVFAVYSFEKIISKENKIKNGGILIEGLYQEIETLNPFLVNNNAEKTIVNLIFDSLVRTDGNGNYEFELAKDIKEIYNGLKYEIELRDDIYWSNGSRITSEDVINTFEYLNKLSNNYLQDYFSKIKIEKLDNKKILFTLPKKDNLFIQKLSEIKIIPSEVWSKYKIEDFKNKNELIKISSGPYFLSNEIIKDNIVIYEFSKNKFYYPKPHLEKIYIYVFKDIKTAYYALKTKKINSLGGLQPNYFEDNLSKEFKITSIVLPRVVAIFFNSKKIPSNLNIEDLNKSLNKNELAKEVFSRYAENTDYFFSPSLQNLFVNFSNKNENQNIELTKTTTTKDYEDLKNEKKDIKFENIELTVPDSFLFNKMANYLQANLGLKIILKSITEINKKIIPNKEYQALLYGISFNLNPNLKIFFEENSVFNLTNSTNDEIIKTIQDIEIGDKKEIYNNYLKLNKQISKLPIIFLVNPYYIYIVPKNLNIDIKYLNDSSERFVKIENWYFE